MTPDARWYLRDRVAVAAVLLVAFAARAGTVWHTPGGFTGNPGYDSGVYYAGADALTHGRVPYRDFFMLHPPGITVALYPFALAGNVLGDHRGFVLANLAFLALGAANACLVHRVCRAAGLERPAALAGSLLYAVWFSAVHPELSIRLEPLGTAAFLIGLLLLLRRDDRRFAFLAGSAFGGAAMVKIWWVVPPVIVLAWLAGRRAERARAGWVLAGTVASGAVIGGPFFVIAPGRMWRMLVTDQVGRARDTGLWTRLRSVTSAPDAFPHHLAAQDALAVVVGGLVLLGVVLGLRVPRLRVVGVVALAQCVLLAITPSFYPFYAGYLTGTVSIAFAAGVSALPRRASRLQPGTLLGGAAVAVCLTLTVIVVRQPPGTISTRVPLARAAGALHAARCVTSDAPFALIQAGVLSRNYERGCPDWVDIVGKVYDIEAHRGGPPVHRMRDAAWQQALLRYFDSSGAVVLMRPTTGVSPQVRSALDARPRLSPGDGVSVYFPRPVK